MRVLALFFAAAVLLKAAANVQPADLRCEYLRNPQGIDEVHPRLSWKLASQAPGAKQAGYRILVASSDRALAADKGDLWDTGRVNSDQSIQVEYAGVAMKSGMPAFWKVQVWDDKGQASAWSSPNAHWSMGLLAPADWKGKWIGRDEPQLYKDPRSPFHLLDSAKWIWGPEGSGAMVYKRTIAIPPGQTIRSAIAVMGADPEFTLDVNGERVGKGTWVYMPERFDIRPYLRAGDNQFVVTATRAPAGKPSGFIGAVKIEFTSGTPLLVTTGPGWEGAAGSGDYGMKPWGEVGFFEERSLPARYLRKEFDAPKAVQRATAYVSGLGLFELYLNGSRVSKEVLAPGLTDYDKRVQYIAYDVTKQLSQGRNAIGVILGNGRFWAPRQGAPIGTRSFGYPKLLLQLEIEHRDGTRSTIVSDETWRLTTNGPILANNEYDGEDYDATREMPGWDKAGYKDASWQPAYVVSAPGGRLVARMTPPLEVTQTLKVQTVKEPKPGYSSSTSARTWSAGRD